MATGNLTHGTDAWSSTDAIVTPKLDGESTVTLSTAGKYVDKDIVVKVASAKTTTGVGSLDVSELNTKTSSNALKDYTQNTSVIVPSKGSLLIKEGYHPNTFITLDQILDGAADTAGTSAPDIRTGKIAYTVDGEKLTGTMGNSTTTGSDNSATASASASAYASTSNLATGTYSSSSATGYTYHVDSSASASVSTVSASKTVTKGYLESNTTATATVTGDSKSASAKTYLLDSTLKNGTTAIASGTQITPTGSNQTITIGKGYYPTDRTVVFKPISAGASGSVDSVVCSKGSVGEYNSTNKNVVITTSHMVNTTGGYISGGEVGPFTSNFAMSAYDGAYTVA